MTALIFVGALAGYAVVGFLVSVVIAAIVTDPSGRADSEPIFLGSLFWPVAVPVFLATRYTKPLWRRMVKRLNPRFDRTHI